MTVRVELIGDQFCPMVVCDACGEHVVGSGNAYWIQGVDHVWHTHKRCARYDRHLEATYKGSVEHSRVMWRELSEWVKDVTYNITPRKGREVSENDPPDGCVNGGDIQQDLDLIEFFRDRCRDWGEVFAVPGRRGGGVDIVMRLDGTYYDEDMGKEMVVWFVEQMRQLGLNVLPGWMCQPPIDHVSAQKEQPKKAPEKKTTPAVPTALYRFHDVYDRLLYIGITKDPPARFDKHGDLKEWWRQVVRIDITWHDSRDEALNAERTAIKTERPLHNVVHNG